MKTFKEIQPGDYIYYYDHGKIKSQLVHEVYETEEEYKWKDWSGQDNITIYKYLIIKAGKRNRTYKLRQYDMYCSDTYFNRMKRFACSEAANNFINYLLNTDERKIKEAKKKLEKYENLKKYHTSSKISLL